MIGTDGPDRPYPIPQQHVQAQAQAQARANAQAAQAQAVQAQALAQAQAAQAQPPAHWVASPWESAVSSEQIDAARRVMTSRRHEELKVLHAALPTDTAATTAEAAARKQALAEGWLDSRAVAEFDVVVEPSTKGLGMVLVGHDAGAKVTGLKMGSVAARARCIQMDDVVVRVDGANLSGMSLQAVAQRIAERCNAASGAPAAPSAASGLALRLQRSGGISRQVRVDLAPFLYRPGANAWERPSCGEADDWPVGKLQVLHREYMAAGGVLWELSLSGHKSAVAQECFDLDIDLALRWCGGATAKGADAALSPKRVYARLHLETAAGSIEDWNTDFFQEFKPHSLRVLDMGDMSCMGELTPQYVQDGKLVFVIDIDVQDIAAAPVAALAAVAPAPAPAAPAAPAPATSAPAAVAAPAAAPASQP
eukprot:g3524.t1